MRKKFENKSEEDSEKKNYKKDGNKPKMASYKKEKGKRQIIASIGSIHLVFILASRFDRKFSTLNQGWW